MQIFSQTRWHIKVWIILRLVMFAITSSKMIDFLESNIWDNKSITDKKVTNILRQSNVEMLHINHSTCVAFQPCACSCFGFAANAVVSVLSNCQCVMLITADCSNNCDFIRTCPSALSTQSHMRGPLCMPPWLCASLSVFNCKSVWGIAVNMLHCLTINVLTEAWPYTYTPINFSCVLGGVYRQQGSCKIKVVPTLTSNMQPCGHIQSGE